MPQNEPRISFHSIAQEEGESLVLLHIIQCQRASSPADGQCPANTHTHEMPGDYTGPPYDYTKVTLGIGFRLDSNNYGNKYQG